jgi:diguanylate cyclase (GGDEF)-like protein/PAS domain S-box-containing protein
MLVKQELYKAVLDKISDGVYVCDRDRRIVYWSPGAERITGYAAGEVQGSSCGEGILMHVDVGGKALCGDGCPLVAAMAGGTPEARVYLHHKDGHRVPVWVRATAVYDKAGQVEGTVEVFSDNSLLVAALRQVEELSVEVETDPLTGLGNRRSMQARLDAYVAERRRPGAAAGLLFIDIDHFKNVNDTHGHDIGDRVLKMVAETIRQNVRSSDWAARWGGEEFLVLLPHVDSNGLLAMGEKLRILVANSFLTIAPGKEVRVTISLGGTLFRPRDTRQTVVARADGLLYESKSKGRNLITWAA